MFKKICADVQLLSPLLFLILLCISCSTDSGKKIINFFGEWNEVGLQYTEIQLIERDEEKVFIGSNTGLFHWDNNTEEFTHLGLNEKEIRGIVQFSDGTLLAGTKASDFSSGDTTLFRLRRGVEEWEPFMNNFGGKTGEYTYISKGPLKKIGISDTIWVRVGNAVARSADKGNHWELVSGSWDSWGGAALLFYFDPYRSGHIWIGGVSALSQAYLYKTIDNGKTWTSKTSGLSDNTEAVAYDVLTHSIDKEMVLVGLSGTVQEAFKIKKSTNMGDNWKTVFEEAGIYTFAQSPRNSEIVYASGRNTTGTLFFLASDDFGDTWQTIEFEDSPGGIYVNDMISVMEDGEEVIYLGTNKGLYSFTVE